MTTQNRAKIPDLAPSTLNAYRRLRKRGCTHAEAKQVDGDPYEIAQQTVPLGIERVAASGERPLRAIKHFEEFSRRYGLTRRIRIL